VFLPVKNDFFCDYLDEHPTNFVGQMACQGMSIPSQLFIYLTRGHWLELIDLF